MNVKQIMYQRVCIGNDESNSKEFERNNEELIEDQSAVTIWRQLRQWPLDNDARNNTLSLVELKRKMGRYHQLPRHMVSAIFDLNLVCSFSGLG